MFLVVVLERLTRRPPPGLRLGYVIGSRWQCTCGDGDDSLVALLLKVTMSTAVIQTLKGAPIVYV